MARGATKRDKVAEPAAPPPKRPRSGRSADLSSIEDQLFFSRIRRRAKWVFVFLAVIFAGTFVFFGVGSGSSGLGDLLNGGSVFGGGGQGRSSTPGIRKAQKLVAQRPQDPAAYRALATAFQAATKPDEAIAPLTKYTKLRPKDSDALLELAALYGGSASRLTTSAQVLQVLPLLEGGSVFKPLAQTELGRALAADPIVESVQTIASTQVSDLYRKINGAYAQQVAVYKQLVALDPQDGSLLVQLATVQQQTGDTQGAIGSYKSFLKIAPDDPLVDAVKQQLKSLQPAAQVPAAGSKSSG